MALGRIKSNLTWLRDTWGYSHIQQEQNQVSVWMGPAQARVHGMHDLEEVRGGGRQSRSTADDVQGRATKEGQRVQQVKGLYLHRVHRGAPEYVCKSFPERELGSPAGPRQVCTDSSGSRKWGNVAVEQCKRKKWCGWKPGHTERKVQAQCSKPLNVVKHQWNMSSPQPSRTQAY